MVETPPILRLIPKLFSARTFVPYVQLAAGGKAPALNASQPDPDLTAPSVRARQRR